MENKRKDEFGKNVSVKNANLWYGDFQAIKVRRDAASPLF